MRQPKVKRFRIHYHDSLDEGFGPESGVYLGYSREHAEERFYDSSHEQGFETLEIDRVECLGTI